MTYYEILEISENASQEVIKMAYKALCKKYHPDVYQGDKHFAEEQIKKINEAFAILSNSTKKKEYDNSFKNKNQYEDKTRSNPKQEYKGTNINNLLKRGFMALEDGEWLKADIFFEQVLNQDAEVAEAYLGKLMIELKVRTKDKLKNCSWPFDGEKNYQRALRFADDKFKNFLLDTIQFINKRNYEAECNNIYTDACRLLSRDADGVWNIEKAISLFKKIHNYKDSMYKIQECEEKIQTIKIKLENERKKTKKTIKRVTISFSIVIAVIVVFVLVLQTAIMPTVNYNKAMQLLENEEFSGAMFSFSAANGYKDSKEHIKKLQRKFDYKISASNSFTVALRKDGTVLTTGSNICNETNIYDWQDIISIETGYLCTIGLKLNGTVVATGNTNHDALEVQSWRNIIAISAGSKHTVGLKSDGTVVATGLNKQGQCNVESWKNIVAISAGNDFTVGLKSDGTVIATGDDTWDKTQVETWTDIIAISAGDDHVVGLKSNGTVVATGHNGCDECEVNEWSDIIAVSAGSWCTVGLKSDGTVVATRTAADDEYRKISRLNNIVAISVSNHLVAVKADGTVVALGNNSDGQCNVYGWDLD